jgi:hypothetical protein
VTRNKADVGDLVWVQVEGYFAGNPNGHLGVLIKINQPRDAGFQAQVDVLIQETGKVTMYWEGQIGLYSEWFEHQNG